MIRKIKFLVMFLLLVGLLVTLVACDTGGNGLDINGDTVELIILVTGEGTVNPEEGPHQFDKDEIIDLEANPEENWKFSHWEGDVADPDSAETTIFMDEDKTVTAHFEEKGAYYQPEVVLVPEGTSSDYWDINYDDITIDYDFFMGKYLVTNANFVEFLNEKDVTVDGYFKGQKMIDMDSDYVQIAHDGNVFFLKEWEDYELNEIDIGNYPVVGVSFYGALSYCNWLSEKEDLVPAYEDWKLKGAPENVFGYRLPESDEWEYAARGGADGDETIFAGGNNLNAVGWYYGNSNETGSSNFQEPGFNAGRGTHSVGLKQPNELGIYDMSGNVNEWTNTVQAEFRLIIRGGSWEDSSNDCEINIFSDSLPNAPSNSTGFRVVKTRFEMFIPPF